MREEDGWLFLTEYRGCENISADKIGSYALTHSLKVEVVEIVSLFSSHISLESVPVTG